MKKILYVSLIAVVAVAAYAVLSNCGGSDSGSTTGSKLVDPYIVGAVLFEDVNNDGVQQATEQSSTPTDANGTFTFPNPLTVGSTIRLTATTGSHAGVTYTGAIAAKVTDAAAFQVVSPMTTLLANGWTAQNVVDVLTAAGLTGITVADVTKDPMTAFNMTDTVGAITDAKLADIQASITIYSFLSIIEGIIKNGYDTGMGSNGFALTYAMFVAHPYHTALLANMVFEIKRGLSKSVLQSIADQIAIAKAACADTADATVSEIVLGSVAIANYIIPKVIASCATQLVTPGVPDCNYPGPSAAVSAAWSENIGKSLYVIRTKANSCTSGGVSMGFLPNTLAKTYCTIVSETGTSADVVCN